MTYNNDLNATTIFFTLVSKLLLAFFGYVDNALADLEEVLLLERLVSLAGHFFLSKLEQFLKIKRALLCL